MEIPRTASPSDATDDAWAVAAPSLTLMDEPAPPRRHDRRAVVNARRWRVRTGAPWRSWPHAFPPGAAVDPPTHRGRAAAGVAAMAPDRRMLLREAFGRDPQPTAVSWDGRTLQAPPDSGQRAGFAGHKQRQGAHRHAAVDRLGLVRAARRPPANAQARAPVGVWAEAVHALPGGTVAVACGDHGDTGEDPAEAAAAPGLAVVVVRLPAATRGFVLRPRRWGVARACAWATRFRRRATDDERLPETVVGLPVVAFACLMLHRAIVALGASP